MDFGRETKGSISKKINDEPFNKMLRLFWMLKTSRIREKVNFASLHLSPYISVVTKIRTKPKKD